jgi:site-specific recombinase XerC
MACVKNVAMPIQARSFSATRASPPRSGYTQVNLDHLIKAYDDAHPRAR